MIDVTEDRLWSVKDASRYLGIPVYTLYQWRNQGKGPVTRKIGRHIRYVPSDVREWVETQPTEVV